MDQTPGAKMMYLIKAQYNSVLFGSLYRRTLPRS